MITAHLVLYLRRKVLLTLLLAAGCAGMFMVTPARDLEPGWAWLALAIGLVAIVGPCWGGLFKVIDTFETAAVRVGQFWAAAEMPGGHRLVRRSRRKGKHQEKPLPARQRRPPRAGGTGNEEPVGEHPARGVHPAGRIP